MPDPPTHPSFKKILSVAHPPSFSSTGARRAAHCRRFHRKYITEMATVKTNARGTTVAFSRSVAHETDGGKSSTGEKRSTDVWIGRLRLGINFR